MLDLITIGDAAIDTFIKIHDASVHCDKNHQNCTINIKWGTKIPVDALGHEVGGNAVNVAVGASRLGLHAGIYTNVGDDEAGHRILKTLKDEKVADDFVLENHGMQSNYSAILSFQGERTIFSYHQDWHYNLPALPSAKWLYLSSCGEEFSRGNFVDEIVDYVTANSIMFAYNPGSYQLKTDVKSYPQLLAVCSLFIVNLEEARNILEMNPKIDVDVKHLLTGLHNLGPKRIVITSGEQGSFSYDGREMWHLPKVTVNAIQAVGAGDAYGSGLVAALVHGKPLPEAMVWGAFNSAGVVAKLGAQRGLLTREQMHKFETTHSSFKAKEF